jgi:hypothetical protein
VKEKRIVGSSFVWALNSDRIHKVTKDVNVQVYLQGDSKFLSHSNSIIFYQRILGSFCSYCVLLISVYISSEDRLKRFKYRSFDQNCRYEQ